MKHAILIMGHSNPDGIEYIVKRLQDNDVDFYIHWDISSKINLERTLDRDILKKVTVIPSGKVYWGGSTQISAQLKLFKAARSKKKYGYYHLISDMDIPAMDVHYFKQFFNKYKGTEYIGFSNKDDSRFGWDSRVKYYFPFENYEMNRNIKKILEHSSIVVQKIFQVNRLKNTDLLIKKGPSWFSITDKVVEYILNKKSYIEEIFGTSSKADEIYMQTLISQDKYLKSRLSKGSEHGAALRYIDWERGNPYMFKDVDVKEIKAIFNTEYAFLRKINIKTESVIKREL
ncbi:Putative glycosyl transferase, polysaccharide biosynthesis [Latilactobacillus curvatus]|uniref:beta-1,6-N-acetylglucosaminyltransferase n=1 Tax=Latilactobacillus curvatus TaxID=28038 RepID=UPI000A1B222A|nr:beta-1,6-N-acetylglucosaminyltransferase [Latilactobacillus curvatus]SMH69114.1 Putative glycosyl transferase, polysaccharide biosynthesis [Latilactobacillus curvatus]